MKTHIFCIIDRSGSMQGLEKATIDGYNSYIDELRGEKNTELTLVLFDDQYEVVIDGTPIKQVPKLDKDTYFVRGGTALIDAVCRTLNERKGNVGKQDKGLVLIITDGYENSSREYKSDAMKKLISGLEEKGNFSFVYMGANQDAWDVAKDWGFNQNNVATYTASGKGMGAVYANVATSSLNMMRGSAMTTTDFFSEKQKVELESTI